MKILPKARRADYCAGVSFLLYFYTFLPTFCHVRAFIDVQWEFVDGLEGWGRSTANEMNADVYHRGDELWMEVIRANPYIDSPWMNVTINHGQNLAFRYRIRGGVSAFAKLELNMDPPYDDDKLKEEVADEEQPNAYVFPIQADGSWHIAYVDLAHRLESIGRNILRMRLFPSISSSSDYSGQERRVLSNYHTTNIQVDWIRLARHPIIYRVTGCFGDKYATNENFDNISYLFGAPIKEKVSGGELEYVRTNWVRDEKKKFSYASTYNCLRTGNEHITIEGINFGEGGIDGKGASAQVLIDNRLCSHVIHDHEFPQERLTCTTPPSSFDIDEYHHQPSLVKVKNGRMPGLVGTTTKLSYASAPPIPVNAETSNIASRSIDLSWMPGGQTWQHLTYTGYVIRWRQESTLKGSWTHSMVVGNVTSTTIRDLSPNTTYMIAISGICEDQSDPEWWNNLDRYGRRQALAGALEGRATIIQSTTLLHDVYFPNFNSNLTQNHGAEIKSAMTKGPTGVYGGEGHYGLIFVGSASIANCNMSSFCCDEYDHKYHHTSGGGCVSESSLTCLSRPPSTYLQYSVEDDDEDWDSEERGIDMVIAKLSSYSDLEFDKRLFNSQCGPSLRLTPSMAKVRGAVWYRRQLEVEEGFDTTFSFEISNPSKRGCEDLDNMFSHCQAYGGDGFAFVIQTEKEDALGESGMGLGFEGIQNSLAIEFDTYNNYENSDPYINHISVHTSILGSKEGAGQARNSANHTTCSLGHTNAIPRLTQGQLTARIHYVPQFDVTRLSSPSFVVSPPYASFFMNQYQDCQHQWQPAAAQHQQYQRKDQQQPTEKEHGHPPTTSTSTNPSHHNLPPTGLGFLTVYIQDLNRPVLSVPLNLSTMLHLNHGRAWVGFTASTGQDAYQTHDIYSWQFHSLRKDPL